MNVLKSTCLISALLVLPVLAGRTASAEETFPVAVLNMDRVFKTYQPLLDKLAPIKDEAKELEQTVQLRQAELETVATQLRGAQPGTSEFQKLQAQAVKLQNELRQFVEKERAGLQKQESVVYLAFFRELEEAVRKYSKDHGIKLVIRQQDNSLDENQPLADILKTLNRGIIYEDELDITDEILIALTADRGNER
jgi:Skp family chaperone for outer membrane proteins